MVFPTKAASSLHRRTWIDRRIALSMDTIWVSAKPWTHLGGSYSNPGLYNKVAAKMTEFLALVSTRGITENYTFLSNREKYMLKIWFWHSLIFRSL